VLRLFVDNGTVSPSSGKARIQEMDNFKDIRGEDMHDAELMIPVSCLDNAKAVTVRFFTALVLGETRIDL
jgi:hypothetical protein